MAVEFLDSEFLGNTISAYLVSTGIILFGLLLKKYLSKFFSFLLYRLFKRFSSGIGVKEFQSLLTRPISAFLLLLLILLACSNLNFPEQWHLAPAEVFGVRMVLFKLFHIALFISIAMIFIRLVDFFGLVLMHRASLTESKIDDQLVPFFKDGLKIILVIVFIFLTLGSVFNVNVVTLIGGLGIGGLAVALAAKETLENLLGSFTIFLDKPFIVGDHIQVDNLNGHVERIGLRSTRIRTFEKSLVTVPNKKMVDAVMENITERTFWRARFHVGLLYQTSAENIRNISVQLKTYLENHHMITDEPKVALESFGSSSIDLLVVYLVRTSDFDVFLKVKEEVNYKVMELVRSNNSDFAFPSTSVYVEKNTPAT